MEIINLDMTPSTVTPNAHAGQYDASRTVRFMLKNGGVPFTLAGTETITAEITRSDGTEVTVNVANTSSNYVDVVFDDTVCTVKGLYACELRLKDSGGFDIGSKNFALLVQRDPYDGAGVHVETVGPADICTFETTLPEPLQSVIVDVLATGGNGTPDNPNPINGYSSANITRCGVNLWDEEWEVGTLSASGQPTSSFTNCIRSKNFNVCSPSTEFYLRSDETGGGADNIYYIKVAFYNENKDFISSTWCNNHTITSPANAKFFKIATNTASYVYGNTYNNDISFLYPYATDTTYHAYNGQTYTVSFGQTVYGGQLDVTRGKLHVTHTILDMGDYTYVYNSSVKRFSTSTSIDDSLPPASDSQKADILASAFTAYPVNQIQEGLSDMSIGLATNKRIYIRDGNYTDPDLFKTAVTGQEVVYPLATPFDIDLTPEVISAIVGENNVFADCGQSTVKYLKAGA